MGRPRASSTSGDVLDFTEPPKRAPPKLSSSRRSSTGPSRPTPQRPPRGGSSGRSSFNRRSSSPTESRSRARGRASSDTESDGGSNLKRGDKVEARYRGGSRYYQGVISRDNRDGTYDIDYDDGEKEKGVKESYIRKISGGGGLKHSPRGGKSSSSRNDNIDDDGNLSRGDKIEARYRGGSKYYPGKIARDNRDGTYDIDYDDGEKERGVKKSYIKSTNSSFSSPRNANDDEPLERGDKIEARYRKGAKFYPGTVARVNRDDTYDIDYDDGEKESRVGRRLINKVRSKGGGLKHSPRGGDDDDMSRGDKVEARYRGGSKYYPGKISRDNRDGTYDIDYDDGEKERGVKKSYIKKLGGGSRSKSPRRGDDTDDDAGLSRGDKVEARYRGGSKYYPGKISRDNRDGTYDIDYDDGEKEKG
ncbi:hypothetical protein TrRE_jg12489, partial [Triparma retinervis]